MHARLNVDQFDVYGTKWSVLQTTEIKLEKQVYKIFLPSKLHSASAKI